jgi:carbonic anhydrase
MAGAPDLDSLIASATAHAAVFAQGAIPGPPAKHLIVVTCMDSRVRPETFLNLGIGDAHILRNAGGRVTKDVLRSLMVSTNIQKTCHIFIVHHTDCGVANFSQHHIETIVTRESGHDASDVNFRAIDDTRQALDEDVERVRECRTFPPGVDVSGWMYDVKTGRLDQRVAPLAVGSHAVDHG